METDRGFVRMVAAAGTVGAVTMRGISRRNAMFRS